MKKGKTLQEELSRMKYLAGILNEAVGQPAPSGQQVPNAPAQQSAQQADPAKTAQNIQTTMNQAMGQLVKDLPNILKNFTTTAGDKDSELDITGQPQAKTQAQPQQAKPQAQAQPQAIKESDNQRELMFDEDKYKSNLHNDVNEGGVIGLIASLPVIAKVGGNLISKLGKKVNSQNMQAFGNATAAAGEKLHHVYIGTIENIISPFMKNADPETKHKVAEAVFMTLVGVLFAQGLSNPDLLTHIKGAELVNFVKPLLPASLSLAGLS